MFIILTQATALSLAVVSESFSVIGLAATFPSIYWSVISMGAVLGAGKLIAASFVYRFWHIAPKTLIIPMSVFVIVLTMITMVGHFGYLSKGYLADSHDIKTVTAKLASLSEEKDRKLARKVEIDSQIANIPPERVTARIRLSKQFEAEQIQLTTRINEIELEITKLKDAQIDADSHSGPISYIATALGASQDNSMKWFILLLVSVFDPLTLATTVSISVMIAHRKYEEEQLKAQESTPKPRRKRTQEVETVTDSKPLDEFFDAPVAQELPPTNTQEWIKPNVKTELRF